MRILEAARASGLSADRIRLYERQGVLPRPPRTQSGYRDYTEEHLVSLRLAKVLRDLGLPLQRVGLMISICHDGTCDELRGALIEHLDEALTAIDAHIDDLERARQHVGTLRDGLRRLHARNSGVPGTTLCACIQLLGAGG